jgi:quinol monooxygenase YgiN
MNQTGIRVVARLTAQADKVEALQSLLQGLLQPTRAENGCISYELLHNTTDATDFTFVEEWTSEDALQDHFQSDHLQAARSQFPDLLAAEADIRIYTLAG